MSEFRIRFTKNLRLKNEFLSVKMPTRTGAFYYLKTTLLLRYEPTKTLTQ